MNQINLTELDQTTAKVLRHLQEVQEQLESGVRDPDLDDTLINNFCRMVSNDKTIVFKKQLERLDENQFLISFISVLTNLLIFPINQDSQSPLIDLLNVILSYLSFDQITFFYPREFIVSRIESASPNATNLIINILSTKLNDTDLIDFLRDTNILDTLVTNHLSTDDYETLPLSVVNNTEKFISRIVDLNIFALIESKLFSNEAYQLYEKTRGLKNSTLITRLLDLLIVLLPYWQTFNLNPSLYTFNSNDLNDLDDPFYPLLIIQFYTNFVKNLKHLEIGSEELFNNIKPPIDQIVQFYLSKNSNPMIESFYVTQIIELIETLSYSSLSYCQSFVAECITKHNLFKSYNLYLDNESDVLLLSKINYQIFDQSFCHDFFNDNLTKISLFNQKFFTIFLNLVKSEHVFNLIITSDVNYFNFEKISKLSIDHIYYIILQISKYNHSTVYLINNLPTIITDYLINSPFEIINNEIWNLKLACLENLLFNSDIDLKIWLDDLKKTYSLMKNGHNIKSINPQVDIASDTI